MDDAFVLVSAFQQPDVIGLPPKQRVQKALSRAGTSITVTSLTDIVAFMAGSITDIPAIQAFCHFAAIGIAFDFSLQITFFVVLMILSAKREETNRYDWLCCVTSKNPSQTAARTRSSTPPTSRSRSPGSSAISLHRGSCPQLARLLLSRSHWACSDRRFTVSLRTRSTFNAIGSSRPVLGSKTRSTSATGSSE